MCSVPGAIDGTRIIVFTDKVEDKTLATGKYKHVAFPCMLNCSDHRCTATVKVTAQCTNGKNVVPTGVSGVYCNTDSTGRVQVVTTHGNPTCTGPWSKSADTGASSACTIHAGGISVTVTCQFQWSCGANFETAFGCGYVSVDEIKVWVHACINKRAHTHTNLYLDITVCECLHLHV